MMADLYGGKYWLAGMVGCLWHGRIGGRKEYGGKLRGRKQYGKMLRVWEDMR